MRYNEEHGITPQQIRKAHKAINEGRAVDYLERAFYDQQVSTAAEDPVTHYMDAVQLQKSIEHSRQLMLEASKKLDFMLAAQYRDEMLKLMDILEQKQASADKE